MRLDAQTQHLTISQKCALSDLAAIYLEGRSERIEQSFQGKELFEKNKVLFDSAYEISKVFQKEPETLKRLNEDPFVNASGDLAKHLSRQCTIFELKNSREPTLAETLVMKETIEQAEKKFCSSPIIDLSREILDTSKQRTFEKLCNRSLERGQFDKKEMQNINKEIFKESKEITMAQKQEIEISKTFEKQQEIEKQMRIDRGPSIGY